MAYTCSLGFFEDGAAASFSGEIEGTVNSILARREDNVLAQASVAPYGGGIPASLQVELDFLDISDPGQQMAACVDIVAELKSVRTGLHEISISVAGPSTLIGA